MANKDSLEDRLDTVYNLHGEYAYVRFLGDDKEPTPANVYSAVRVNPQDYYYNGVVNGLYAFKRRSS